MEWINHFSERERAEINFALTYVQQFDHGTAGHLGYTVIAKMARRLSEMEKQLQAGEENDQKFMD